MNDGFQIMNIISDIPNGLGEQLLRRKFGKQHSKIADLLMRRISIEAILIQNPHEHIKEQLNQELRSVSSELKAMNDYLRAWYMAYLSLCSECATCSFNHNGEHCTFYGEKKIPHPNPSRPNTKCPHHTPKSIAKKINEN